ncbi:MAG: hypothetical protein P1V51_24015 [Deltaproteobacteria bacterium]|nr:hypothetical protein [Deltaproteobacteria bacterium]
MTPLPDEAMVFRLRPILRWALGGLIFLWGMIFLALLWQREAIPARTYLSVIFFIVLFALVLVFYNGLTITADAYGVTYRGLVSFRNYPYESMIEVEVRPGLTGLVSYDVFTRMGCLHFSSFIEGHRRLLAVITERAKLEPDGRRKR